MATKVSLNGKIISRPGVYTTVKSGIQNAPVALPYGNVAIIDDGIGATWGGGTANTVYEFNTVQDLQSFVKGGVLWDLAAQLFKPLRGAQGASKVFLIHAREATSATISFTIAAGTCSFVTKDQGLNANGSASAGVLRKGYAGKLIAGPTTDKYIFQLWAGSYKGMDTLNNTPYGGVTEANSTPILIAESPEVGTLDELKAWAQSEKSVTDGFTFTIGTGDITPADVTANAGFVLASGATETYTPAAFTAAIDKIKGVDNSLFLSMKSGADANHANNTAILDMIADSKYERFLIIAGGSTAAQFETQSVAAATALNTDKAIVVHGDAKQTIRNGFKRVSALAKAANFTGRLAGLEPQVPITYKQLGIDGEWEELSDTQLERALDKGVVVTFFDAELGYNVVLQGINTLQNNAFLVNDDASSHDIAIKRIGAQLNKELAIFLKRKFFGKANAGPNRNTINEADLIAAVEGFLQSKVASTNTDNLILRFGNITATVEQDVYRVNYEFVPNFPVSKIIVTGLILEN